VVQGLAYCNYCGAKLNSGERDAKPSDISPGSLVTSMVATFVLGTFVITLLMGMMKVILRFEYSQILALTSLSFLIMLALETVFITLLLQRTRGSHKPRETRPNNRVTTKELEAESRLPLEPVPSVTEHTTRAFDPVYSERK
jgi:hypothetical protein